MSPGLLSLRLRAAANSPRSSGTTLATTVPTTFGTLFWIRITRYWRPKTVCSVAEKLTCPRSSGTLWNFSICAASVAPFVDPPARLIAVTTPSIAAAPVTKPPVPAFTCFASLLTAGSDRRRTPTHT